MRGSRVKRVRRLLAGGIGKPGRKHKQLLEAPIHGVVRVVLATGRKPTLWQRR